MDWTNNRNRAVELEMLKSTDIAIQSKEECEKRCLEWNSMQGSSSSVECPICKNKEVVMGYEFVDIYGRYEVYLKDCSCKKERNRIATLKANGYSKYLNKKFDGFVADNDWRKKIKETCMDFCENSQDEWLAVLGQSGCGKTLIISMCANFYADSRKRTTMFLNWSEFINEMKRELMEGKGADANERLKKAKQVDVLVIDDLLKLYTEADKKYAYEIINYRYDNQKKTLITSEFSEKELLSIDEATFSRVSERTEKKYMLVVGKDRMKNARTQ